jgi:Tol biopolymer transport system component
VVAGVAFWAPWRTPPIPEVVRFQVPPPEKSNFGPYPPAISPDGRQLAYIVGAGAEARIWVRSLDTLEARALPGTENAVSSVFWSPDGRSLGFQAAPPGPKLKRVEVAGGPPQTLCETPQPITGAWSPQGVIVFGLSGGLQRVPAGGGACTALTKVDPARGETFHRFPSFLPDGKHFLYLRVSGKTEFQGIYIGSLDADPSKPDLKRLLATDSRTIYAPPAGSGPGHLLFVREGSLMAQSFDPGRQELIGDAVPVAERVGNGSALVGQFFSVSANGALVYRTGVTAGGGNRRITVFDRQGKVVSTAGETAENTTPVFSPDGTLVAFQHADAPGSLPDIWLYDLIRKVPTRFTFDPAGDYAPVWSPDSRYVVFGSEREGGIRNLYRKVASNAGVEQVLLKSGDSKTALDWSRDGRFLLFIDVGSTTGADLWYLPLTGPEGTPGKAEPYLTSQFNDSAGRFAPDGRFVAYVSDASSRNDVYVRTFPDPSGGQWTVSTGGGTNPRWRRDGKELYYLAPGGSLMAVEVILSPTFKAGVPKEVFKFPLGQNFFDADAKGERFVKAVEVDAAPEGPPSPVTVVLNWAAGLRK